MKPLCYRNFPVPPLAPGCSLAHYSKGISLNFREYESLRGQNRVQCQGQWNMPWICLACVSYAILRSPWHLVWFLSCFERGNHTDLVSKSCSTCVLTQTQLQEEWDFFFFFNYFSLQNLLVQHRAWVCEVILLMPVSRGRSWHAWLPAFSAQRQVGRAPKESIYFSARVSRVFW